MIGGICNRNKKFEAINAYEKIKKVNLGQYKDEFLIDYVLAKAIEDLSPKCVRVVGASIHINGVKYATGGIIGNPLQKCESANGDIEEIEPGLFLISIPGGHGIAFSGTYEQAVALKKIILYGNEHTQEAKIKELLNKVDKMTKLYLFVVDGTGDKSIGRIFVSDNYGKNYEFLD